MIFLLPQIIILTENFLFACVSQAGIVKRMKEKENERDIAERELSSFSLSTIDEKEKKLVVV